MRRHDAMHRPLITAVILLCTAFVRGQGICRWRENGPSSLCVATTDDPAGLRFAQWQLDLQRCIRFSDSNTTIGCTTELPECTSRVLTDPSEQGVSQRICFPANATISRIDQQSFIVALGNCSGDSSPTCDEVREEAYPLLGCSGCAAAASAAIELVPLCAAAQGSEVVCLAADGVIDAPAPAPAMAPEPLEDSPMELMPPPAPAPGPLAAASPDPAEPPSRGVPAAPPVAAEDEDNVVLENGVAGGSSGSPLIGVGLAFGCLVLAVLP